MVSAPFTYTAYGLLIASETAIPELPTADAVGAEPDVVIRIGEVPAALPDVTGRSPVHQTNRENLLLEITDVGRYLVSSGSRIVVSPSLGASSHEVRVFLLGTCFGALLHQRGALVLHASGIGTPQGAVLFAGHSGSGKSTLLTEMLNRGHRMLVDDVCAIFPVGDGLVVPPAYPRSRLWSDAAANLGVDTDGLPRTRSHMDKYERQVSDQFWTRSDAPRRIYYLAGEHGDVAALARVPMIAAVPVLVANTYRELLLDGFGARQRHFDVASRIARSVPIVQVVRPAGAFSVSEVADLITDDMEEE